MARDDDGSAAVPGEPAAQAPHARRPRCQDDRDGEGEEVHAGGEGPGGPGDRRERDAQLRELTDQAHGANLDLGHALVHNLTTVEPIDVDVARFFRH